MPYATARMATVDAREIKVVLSNRSGGRLEPLAGVLDDIITGQMIDKLLYLAVVMKNPLPFERGWWIDRYN